MPEPITSLLAALKKLAKAKNLKDPDEIFHQAGEEREKNLPHWVNKGSSQRGIEG